MKVSIDLQNECSNSSFLFDEDKIITYIETTLETINYQQDAEICIILVDENQIHKLNKEYRHVDKPTNILSFPFECPPEVKLDLLGDLIVCFSVLEQEAKDQQKSLMEHFCHLIVHGTLHLLGYDHIQDDEALIMENLEIDILHKLGFANPYEIK